ncbi:MAG: NAD(P)/FAD-dependent oxidoreductase [Methyloceanibacter sp.]
MSRTPLFAAVKRALAHASHEHGVVFPRSSALTRRSLLRLSAAAASAAALAPVGDWSAYAKQKERHKKPVPHTVAIVGGGVAGLTAAYRLHAAGASPVLFEASNRWGGRMFTQYDFYKGMFCELGGEFVDTDHEDLQTLAKEVGVEMENLTADGGDDLYFFKGVFHTPSDMIDPAKKSGAFGPIAKQIAKDAAKLTDKDDNWTAHARKLDNVSLKAYLEQFRGKTDDWTIDVLDVAYNIEYGLLTEDQSSLALVDFITTDMSKPFSMFGPSDEIYRIKGGSSALITALVNALQNKIEMKQGFALTGLDQKDKQIVMTFDAPGGAQTVSYDAVILALPFTKLRQVNGLESLNLGAEKLKCIRELGYGINAKVMNGTTSRPWRGSDTGLPAPSDGTFYSDLGFQNLWDSSRAQPGEAGIITNYLGAKPGLTDAKSALDAFRADLPKMSQKMADSLDPNAVTSWFWAVYPYTLGSYASAKVGQYTTLLDVAPEPALKGRLQFAGEHTSSEFLGFMNGGVQSGNRASAALIKIMALHK